jgi:phytoene synthase
MVDLTGPLAQTVRQADYDRFLTTLFAPDARRADLLALYAFNYEVAKTAEIVTQPLLGEIRLQWWRDAVEELYAGKVRQHETVIALATALQRVSVPRRFFDQLIDAREHDLTPMPFATMQALEAYADATSGHVMRVAARLLGAGEGLDAIAGDAGVAYGLTGILRAIPFHARQRRILLPEEFLVAAGLHADDFLSGRSAMTRVLVDRVVAIAQGRLRAARQSAIPRRQLPALLPASLVAPYLRAIQRGDFDPFRHGTSLSVPRRQLALLSAMMRSRI